jgi:chromosome segregation ATPase
MVAPVPAHAKAKTGQRIDLRPRLAPRVAKRRELRHYPPIEADEIVNDLSELERELERARQAAAENDAALQALEEQRAEREGRLRLARRAAEDFERRIEEKRLELRRAEAEAAAAEYERSLDARRAAAERFASAVDAVVAELHGYEAAKQEVARAWEAAGRSGAADLVSDDNAEADPEVVTESIDTLVAALRDRLGGQLEHEIVEAAARSPMGHDISKLPAHLQTLARARRVAIAQQARRRRDDAQRPKPG